MSTSTERSSAHRRRQKAKLEAYRDVLRRIVATSSHYQWATKDKYEQGVADGMADLCQQASQALAAHGDLK